MEEEELRSSFFEMLLNTCKQNLWKIVGRGVGDGARSGEVVLAPFSEFFGITPDYCQERSNDKKSSYLIRDFFPFLRWGGGGGCLSYLQLLWF